MPEILMKIIWGKSPWDFREKDIRYLAVKRPLMVPGSGSVTTLCSGNPSVPSKPEQLVTHINLIFRNHPHAKSLPSFLEHSLCLCRPGGRAFSQPKERCYSTRERPAGPMARPNRFPPKTPTSPGSSPSLGESLYILVDEPERCMWLFIPLYSFTVCYCSYTSKLFARLVTPNLPPKNPNIG